MAADPDFGAGGGGGGWASGMAPSALHFNSLHLSIWLRNKLAFANGIPSDSIAVVNAFKVRIWPNPLLRVVFFFLEGVGSESSAVPCVYQVWYTSRHEGAFRHPKVSARYVYPTEVPCDPVCHNEGLPYPHP